jgi:hypothetical protein
LEKLLVVTMLADFARAISIASFRISEGCVPHRREAFSGL